jgi:hypothetical protein
MLSNISTAARALLVCNGPDQVQFDPVIAVLEIGPAALRLLHPVLAEDAVALAQHGLDPVGRLHLGHRDQRHVASGAVRLRQGGGDAGLDVVERHGTGVLVVVRGADQNDKR